MLADNAKEAENNDILLVKGSAGKLPLADNSVDVVTSFFMLYHMPDISKALQEWKRVLKPDGKLLIVTVGNDNLERMEGFKQEMGEELGIEMPQFTDPFSLDNGKEQLEEHFSIVHSERIEGVNRQSSVGYIDSQRDLFEPVPDRKWHRALNKVRRKIRRDKSYEDKVVTGYFVCSPKAA